jgi:hypothetical protein
MLNTNLYSQDIWTNKYEKAYQEVLKLNFSTSDSILNNVENKTDATEAYIKASNFFVNVMLNNYNNDILKNDSISLYLDIVNSSELESPWINYFQVEILTMKSLINIRLNNKVSSAYNIYKASKLAKSTIKSYPNFAPMKTLHGFQLCTFSQIPDNYKSIASFFGIEGNYNLGIKEITNSLENIDNGIIKDKSSFIEIFSKKEFGKIDSVRISNSIENYRLYPVMIYYESYLLYKDAHISEAEELLVSNEDAWQNKMNYLNYFTGKLLTYSINYNAEIYFSKFLENTKTDNFKQSTYRYLAYLELLRNSRVQYKKYRDLVTDNNFTSQSESDKSALNEVTNIIQPILIKAQLLFDGGYYKKAKDVLLSSPKTSICRSESDFIIYYYRLGSIHYKLNETELAIDNFERCTKFNFNNKFHYQANAYLHLGELYLADGDKSASELNLKKCLDLSNFPYSYSIHGKADKLLEAL